MVAKRIKLDFSKVEERSGWDTKHMPEGLHEFKITGVEDSEAQDGIDMYVFALKPTSPKYKARNFPYYCKLQPNQYWKLRDLLVAAGIKVPKAVANVDPNKAVGKIVAVEITDATGKYEGRSEISGVYGKDILDGEEPADDSEDETEEVEDDEEYEDAEEAEEEEEDEEDEDLEALTLPELRKLAKGLGIDTAGLKKAELIEAIEEEQADEGDEDDEDELDEDDLGDEDLDEEEFEDDEDEEEEPAPKRRAAPARKPAAKPAAKAAPARRVVKRR